MKEQLNRILLNEYKRLGSYAKLGKAIGMPTQTIQRLMTNQRGGRMETWEKVLKWAEKNGLMERE